MSDEKANHLTLMKGKSISKDSTRTLFIALTQVGGYYFSAHSCPTWLLQTALTLYKGNRWNIPTLAKSQFDLRGGRICFSAIWQIALLSSTLMQSILGRQSNLVCLKESFQKPTTLSDSSYQRHTMNGYTLAETIFVVCPLLRPKKLLTILHTDGSVERKSPL